MTQTDVREYPAHWSGTAVRRLSFPPNSRQVRQPGNCPHFFPRNPPLSSYCPECLLDSTILHTATLAWLSRCHTSTPLK